MFAGGAAAEAAAAPGWVRSSGKTPSPARRRGGISLKEAGASLFPGRGRREPGAPCPARGGRDGGACTWPQSPRTSSSTAAPAGSWGVGTQRARGERRRWERGGGGCRGWRRTPRALGPSDGQPSRWASRQPAVSSARSPGQPRAVSSSGTGTAAAALEDQSIPHFILGPPLIDLL